MAELSKYGFNGAKEAERLKKIQQASPETAIYELTNNLASLTHEVLKDDPVSSPYELYFGKNGSDKIFSDQKRTEEFAMESQFDPGERGNAPLEAFQKSTLLARLYPGSMILSLSLAGKAGFDNDPTNSFNTINYDTIQMYHMVYNKDLDKIFASAITASNEDLTVRMLKEFGLEPPKPGYVDPYLLQLKDTGRLNSTFTQADLLQASKVLYYLRNPVVTGMSVDSYVNTLTTKFGGEVMHTNKSKTKYTVNDIMHDLYDKIGDAYAGRKPSEKIVERVIADLKTQYGDTWSKDIVDRAYFLTMKYYAMAHNISTIELAGSCGGSTITVGDLEILLGNMSSITTLMNPETVLSPMTSQGRLLQQDILKSVGIMTSSSCEKMGCNHREKHFHCPDKANGGCGKPIKAGVGHDRCPHCNLSKDDYAKKTGIKC